MARKRKSTGLVIIDDQGEEQEVYLQDQTGQGPAPPAAASLLEEGLRARSAANTASSNTSVQQDTKEAIKESIANGHAVHVSMTLIPRKFPG